METIVLSFGHGSIDPVTGSYHCLAGGKQYTFPDGDTVYEGEINRLYQKSLELALRAEGFKVVVISHNHLDYTLGKRVQLAAEVKGPKILICFHHNASPEHNAAGWEIWTTRKRNNSDTLAEHVWFEHYLLKRAFDNLRMRSDVSLDGDHDFEADFMEIKAFDGPAIYIENGFFDNVEDLERVTDHKYMHHATQAIVRGVVKYINK